MDAQELVWPAELNDDGLYRRIFRALIAVGASTDEASDALQEAYEQILRQKAPPDRIDGWLFVVAQRRWRRQRLRRRLFAPLAAAGAQSVKAHEARTVLSEVAKLPMRQRQVFVARHVLGLTNDETAAGDRWALWRAASRGDRHGEPRSLRTGLRWVFGMPGRIGLYDDRAKRVLALAQDEAWRVFHHDSIGPEHLLLGVLREVSAGGLAPDAPGSIGAVTLKSLGLDLAGARKALEGLSGYGDPDRHLDEIPFTPEAFTVLDLAPAEAEALGEEKVTPTHVLLAVLREPGKAGAMLQSFGLSTTAVRQKIVGSQ